ncbi:sigma-70 family RNA polymerase sigma factor [uncultured Gilvimarinus sp.]|uniref:RNA polymerase sigma factor n=1 Tax=uncultured Gilvimarinus sp. TaxID=1689143 RepID=UPI0030EB76A4|tara:strand:- start:52 stop:594 length:543 start_codon:yes stop_codon:yes gene_type:complete
MHYSNGMERIYFKALGLMRRTVGRVVPPDDVEDIVQETYVKACQIRDLGHIRNPQSFLLKMARNLALDHIKRAEYRLATSITQLSGDSDFELGSEHDSTLDCVTGDQEFSLFCEAVRQLPQQCRRAFVLKKVYGYSQKDIADRLGISESTVEKHIATGLLKSRRFMRNKMGASLEPGRYE